MKIEGEHVFKGPRQEVWEMFYDPEILASALPGTQSLKQVNKNEYEGTLTLRLGPVSGSFAGEGHFHRDSLSHSPSKPFGLCIPGPFGK